MFQYDDAFMYKATPKQHLKLKKLSSTEAELKKLLLIKKSVHLLNFQKFAKHDP